MKLGIIDLIEAVYAPAATDQEWIVGVTEVADAVLTQGMGVAAYIYDASDPANLQLTAFRSTTPSVESAAQIQAMAQSLPPSLVHRAYRPAPPVQLLTERMKPILNTPGGLLLLQVLAQLGVQDVLGILGGDPSGRGCIIGVAVLERKALPARRRHTLSCVAAHLAAGARLRRGLLGEEPAEPDAIFGQDGRVEHLRPAIAHLEKCSQLQRHVEHVVAARGDLRRADPTRALEIWRSLLDGHWSIVDHVDRDGKRFLLARRNAPEMANPLALGRLEKQVAVYAALGHSNKLIAYELGISTARASELLGSVLRKLHLRSRADLVRLFEATENESA